MMMVAAEALGGENQDVLLTAVGLGAPASELVPISIDGTELLATIQIDQAEHARRKRAGVGAVTSTGVLHGLWMLPDAVPIPVSLLPSRKVERLRRVPAHVAESEDTFTRSFSPAGVVSDLVFTGSEVARLVRRACRWTPIVRRHVISPAPGPMHPRTEAEAREWGIGVHRLGGNGLTTELAASDALLGRPAVYRWWLAEIAYESWLQENAQATS